MSRMQTRRMFRHMATGEPVELTSPMSSVRKLARLAFIAEQFGYRYLDARQTGGRNSVLKMQLVPDLDPQVQQRAAWNRANYPQAAEGGPLPPFRPDAVELLKARLKFDLTGKNAEQRMLYGALGTTVGAVILGYRTGGDALSYLIAAIIWAALMVIFVIGFFVNRSRHAKFAALLQSQGFVPLTDESGRVRYLPPGSQLPYQGGQLGAGPYGVPAQVPYGASGPVPYGAQPPGPYAGNGQTPGPYGAQPQPQPQPQAYAPPQPQPQAYAPPQQPYAPPAPQPQPQPYAQPPQGDPRSFGPPPAYGGPPQG